MMEYPLIEQRFVPGDKFTAYGKVGVVVSYAFLHPASGGGGSWYWVCEDPVIGECAHPRLCHENAMIKHGA